MKFSGKFSSLAGSAILVFAGFSLGLAGCGSNDSNSNPGIGGTAGGAVTSIAASCPNPIDGSPLGAAATDAGFDRKTNYTLSSITIYVYNPGTGDSFSASADARDGFQIDSQNICNGTQGNERHPENVTVPESLNSRDSQDRTFTFEFLNKQLLHASSALTNNGQDSFSLDQRGQGPVLASQDEYVSTRSFVGSHGDLEILSETQFPVDRTGNRKLLFISAEYTSQEAIQPLPGKPPGRPGR
jgi:hypothetical protein